MLEKVIFLHANSDLQLYDYCDSYQGACPLPRRYLTRYFITLGESLISWRTTKQATVSKSLVEAEYRSMAMTTNELVWL